MTLKSRLLRISKSLTFFWKMLKFKISVKVNLHVHEPGHEKSVLLLLSTIKFP